MLSDRLKRNICAFDESQRTFDTLTRYTSKNYSPIVIYKLHEHGNLMVDVSMIESVATIYAMKVNKIISNTLATAKTETTAKLFHLEKCNVSKSKEMVEGICLLNQSNFGDEIIDPITLLTNIPTTKSCKSNIIEIKFEVESEIKDDNKKYAIIDSTKGDKFCREYLTPVQRNSFIESCGSKCALWSSP